jgi:hypothetical protein
MRATEIAWAAGFFDGEGHIYFHRGQSSSAVRLRVRQREPELLLRFQRAVGGYGRIYREKSGIYSFECEGWRAYEIVNALWPYLGSHKRTQYERAIA